jgi:hypothetical protein
LNKYIDLLLINNGWAIPLFIAIMVLRSNMFFVIDLNRFEKVLWTDKTKMFRFIYERIVDTFFIVFLTIIFGQWVINFPKWISTFFYCVFWFINILIIVPKAFITFKGVFPNWLISILLKIISFRNFIISGYLISYLYSFGYIIFESKSISMNEISNDEFIKFAFLIILSISIAFVFSVMNKWLKDIIDYEGDYYAINLDGVEHRIIKITNDNLVQLEATNGDGVLFVKKDVFETNHIQIKKIDVN